LSSRPGSAAASPFPADTTTNWYPVYVQKAHYFYGPEGMRVNLNDLPTKEYEKIASKYAKEEEEHYEWCKVYTRHLERQNVGLCLTIWPEHCIVPVSASTLVPPAASSMNYKWIPYQSIYGFLSCV
jgi:hypothetical protein